MAKNIPEKKSGKALWIVLGVVAVLIILAFIIGAYVASSYNSFITLNKNVDQSWSEVENQYQRQSDLIPNLVATVSSQVNSNTKFVKDVIAARTAWANSAGASQLQRDTAGQQMNNGISAFVNAVSESYPTFSSSEAYTALRDELAGTQNRITTARGRYIETIGSFNLAVMRFPSNIIAGMFGFSAKDYYKSQSGTQTPSLGNATLP